MFGFNKQSVSDVDVCFFYYFFFFSSIHSFIWVFFLYISIVECWWTVNTTQITCWIQWTFTISIKRNERRKKNEQLNSLESDFSGTWKAHHIFGDRLSVYQISLLQFVNLFIKFRVCSILLINNKRITTEQSTNHTQIVKQINCETNSQLIVLVWFKFIYAYDTINSVHR